MDFLEPYYTEEDKLIGQIDLFDGLVDVTDPCYERDTWCAVFDLRVLPGKYNCFIDVANFPYEKEHDATGETEVDDDKRIMSLTILHESYGKDLRAALIDFEPEVEAEVGVDAGLCGFYSHKRDFAEETEWDNFWKNLARYEGRDCDVKVNGVTVSSGFGDGYYPVYKLTNNNGEITGLRLDFSDGIIDR